MTRAVKNATGKGRVGAVVQARMGSTRLPGKVMLDLAGAPVLDHVIRRLQQCRRLDCIVIATSTRPEDDVVVRRAERSGALSFRGSETDVLSRYHGAATQYGLDTVVRVTSDCPLIDPHVVDEVIGYFLDHEYDLVSNAGDEPGKRTFPRGLDVEVFSFDALRDASARAVKGYQREHVTPYVYENASVHYFKGTADYSSHRWTLDTREDYDLISQIYAELYHGKHDFYLGEILDLMQRRPDLPALNTHVEQKKLEQPVSRDFDAEFEALIERHDMRPRLPRHTRLEKAVLAAWADVPRDAVVLVWGDEEHTCELLNLLRPAPGRVAGFIDPASRSSSGELIGCRRLSMQDAAGLEPDIVVLSSFARREKHRAEVLRRFPRCRVLDFYEALDFEGVFGDQRGFPFYSGTEYVRLFELCDAYRNAHDKAHRKALLFELAATYYEIRDFLNGEKCAREYAADGHDDGGRVAAFVTATNALLAELRGSLLGREGDIALFLVDAIRMRDVRPAHGEPPAMPFLLGMSQRAVTFTRAFSSTLYTVPSVPSMLTGKLPLDDVIYNKRIVSVDESALLRTLHGEGYRLFNFISWKDFFEGETRVTPVRFSRPGDALPLLSRALAPRILWRHATTLAGAPQRAFCLVHLFCETHDPHLCGAHGDAPVKHLFYEYLGKDNPGISSQQYRAQFRECLAYVDRQLEFHFGFLPEGMTKAVFGDHGQIAERILEHPEAVGSLLSWHDDRIHVALILEGPRLAAASRDSLFSMSDLGGLILDARHGKLAPPPRRCVQVQFDPLYNKAIKAAYARVGCEKYTKGFKAIRGERDKFVLYDDGTEEYYLLPDERNNRIGEPQLADSVKFLRSFLKSRTFPDFIVPE